MSSLLLGGAILGKLGMVSGMVAGSGAWLQLKIGGGGGRVGICFNGVVDDDGEVFLVEEKSWER